MGEHDIHTETLSPAPDVPDRDKEITPSAEEVRETYEASREASVKKLALLGDIDKKGAADTYEQRRAEAVRMNKQDNDILEAKIDAIVSRVDVPALSKKAEDLKFNREYSKKIVKEILPFFTRNKKGLRIMSIYDGKLNTKTREVEGGSYRVNVELLDGFIQDLREMKTGHREEKDRETDAVLVSAEQGEYIDDLIGYLQECIDADQLAKNEMLFERGEPVEVVLDSGEVRIEQRPKSKAWEKAKRPLRFVGFMYLAGMAAASFIITRGKPSAVGLTYVALSALALKGMPKGKLQQQIGEAKFLVGKEYEEMSKKYKFNEEWEPIFDTLRAEQTKTMLGKYFSKSNQEKLQRMEDGIVSDPDSLKVITRKSINDLVAPNPGTDGIHHTFHEMSDDDLRSLAASLQRTRSNGAKEMTSFALKHGDEWGPGALALLTKEAPPSDAEEVESLLG